MFCSAHVAKSNQRAAVRNSRSMGYGEKGNTLGYGGKKGNTLQPALISDIFELLNLHSLVHKYRKFMGE